MDSGFYRPKLPGFRITLHGANEDSSPILPKINTDLHPVFASKEIVDDMKVAEAKPPLINVLSINSNVICVMRIMLENTYVTPTIRRTKIFGNNLLSLRNVGGNLNA